MEEKSVARNGRTVLNVGGGGKGIPLPPQYEGWRQLYLDIDSKVEPDVLCDARSLADQPGDVYDAIFCSHNLEHYFHHEAPKVLRGFHHVLKEDGFAEILVPDLESLMRTVVQESPMDLEKKLYDSLAGPITALDVVYGYGKQIAVSNEDYYAHKTGFTCVSLQRALSTVGFNCFYTGVGNFEIRAVAFKSVPLEWQRTMFGIS